MSREMNFKNYREQIRELQSKNNLLGLQKNEFENLYKDQQQKIEQLEKEVKKWQGISYVDGVSRDILAEENTKLKELVKELEEKDCFDKKDYFDGFYTWLDSLSQSEYDNTSLTDKIEKYFFK